MNLPPDTRRLTAGEAEMLWRAWKTRRDQRSRDRLVLSYTPMVKHLASKRARALPSHRELEDLVSCGLLALVETVDRFDPAKGATFEQFAWLRVSGAIVDELRRLDRVSRSTRSLGRKIDAARETFTARENRKPSEHELADVLKIRIEELRHTTAELDRAPVVSLNKPAGHDDDFDLELGDTLAARPGEYDPERALLARERTERFRKAMASLTERERLVLALIHVQNREGAEVGRMLGVTDSRVSQILTAARTKLKSELDRYEQTPELVAA